jgi:hypothetical protein
MTNRCFPARYQQLKTSNVNILSTMAHPGVQVIDGRKTFIPLGKSLTLAPEPSLTIQKTTPIPSRIYVETWAYLLP